MWLYLDSVLSGCICSSSDMLQYKGTKIYFVAVLICFIMIDEVVHMDKTAQ